MLVNCKKCKPVYIIYQIRKYTSKSIPTTTICTTTKERERQVKRTNKTYIKKRTFSLLLILTTSSLLANSLLTLLSIPRCTLALSLLSLSPPLPSPSRLT